MAYIGRVNYLRGCYDTYRDYIDKYIYNPRNLSEEQIEDIASHFRVKKTLVKKYIDSLPTEHKMSVYEKVMQRNNQNTLQNV